MAWSVSFLGFVSAFYNRVNFQTASHRLPSRGPVGLRVRRSFLGSLLAVLAAASLLLSASVAQAQNYGDFKVIGTGADAGISFEFLATVPPLTPGLSASFSFVSCTVPSGETCNEFAYSARGGQIRLITLNGGNVVIRTWNFSSMLHTGVYVANSGGGSEPGYALVSGADATAGQPQSNATGIAFQFPIEVTVTSSSPTVQSGVTVSYTAPSSGPSASLPSSGQATTDNTGRARITPTANGIAGAYQITASATVGGNTFQTSFIAANVNTANATGACQVTTANDDFSAGSLRYQVAACGKGGTITFASGITTVNLSAGQDIPLTQDLTIDGGSGVVINAQSLSRIFFVTGGTISLKNLTLENGSAAGGAGGAGSPGGGGAAGMGGAIFVNAGSLEIDNVNFTSNQATGGDGGTFISSLVLGGGGGVGGLGGSSGSSLVSNGNGGGGGDFGSSGGGGRGASGNGSGDGAGGGNGGSGAFAGGGSGDGMGGTGGFGAGGGGGLTNFGPGGAFGGNGAQEGLNGGGAGAGLGGAIFMRNGTLSFINATFTSNIATGGMGESGGSNGQGKGGALYISASASATTTGVSPIFNSNSASNAGTGTACNTVAGLNALDTNDICGILVGGATHFSVSASSPQASNIGFTVTVTALDANNNVVTGYSGIVQLTSTDPGFVNITGDNTLTNGVGTFNVVLKQSGTQTITATDFADGSVTGTSSNIVVNPGQAIRLMVLAPGTANLGGQFQFMVTASDVYGNVATNYAGTVRFASSDPTASLPVSSMLTSGTGIFYATLNTQGSQTITATDTTNALTGTSGNITVSIPSLVVTSTADSGAGTLRAALATAAANGSGSITFDPTVFATAQTITLTSGTLNIPSNTTITGATSGSSATLKNLVTVSGNNAYTVFAVNSGVTGASIANLTVTGGNAGTTAYSGGAITNGGALTVSNDTFSANSGIDGGAIESTGTLTVIGSTFSKNTAPGVSGTSGWGGAIVVNLGTARVTNSTFLDNSSTLAGGSIYNQALLAVSNSTFSGNSSGEGGAIANNTLGAATANNSIFSANSSSNGGGAVVNFSVYNSSDNVYYNNLTNGSEDDCNTCSTNTNAVSATTNPVAALSSYGGPTQTMIPLPGSAAICAGASSLVPGGTTTDQRGYSRTTTYGSMTCVDAGAVQTDYAMSFTTEPASTENSGVAFSAAVTLNESGSAFTAPSVSIPVTLGGGATLSGSPVSASTSAGVASYSLTATTASPVSGQQLDASLMLNAGLTPPLAITAASSNFSLSALSAPSISTSFSPTSITAGANSILTITISNPTPVAITNVSFSNTVPSGTTLVTETGGTCATLAGTNGGTTNLSASAISVTSNQLAAGASCYVTLKVASNTVGNYTDTTSTVTSSQTTAGTAASASLTVTAATVTASVTAANKTYNGSTAATITGCTVTGVLSGDTNNVTCSATGATFATKNAGTGITVTATGIRLSGTAAGNYTLASTTATTTANITQAPMTITAATNSKTYDATTSAAAVPTVGSGQLQGTDTVTGLAEVYASASAGTGKTLNVSAYTINDGNSGNNYQVSTVPNTTGVITPATVTASVTAASKTYNGSTAATITSCSLSGVLSTDSGNVTCSATGAAFATSGAANSITVTATGISLSGSAAGNYTLASTTATTTANIAQAALTIAANNATKTYGTANPTFTGTISGAQNGDSFTESFTTAATISSAVGSYAIVPSVTGTNLADYSQTVANGTLAVTQAASTTTISLNSATITPGQNETITATVASSTTGTPTGTVRFYDGATLLNTATLNAGSATYSTTSLAAGVTHVISAAYSGDTNFTASSSATTTSITVAQLDFTIAISGPANPTVIPGQSITYQATVTPLYGSYAGTVSFAVASLPPGATVNFSPSSIPANAGPQTITVTITTAPTTGVNHEPSPPSEMRRAAPFALAFFALIGLGAVRKRSRALRRLLTVVVLLAGGTAAAFLGGCGGTGGFFAQSPENYTVTITATAGSVQHSANITLEVQ